MKKISLTIIVLFFSLFIGFAQSTDDSAQYKNHKLSFEEANLVSSYYHQEGHNSAVTGGQGTEKLTDISNTFDIKWIRYDKHFRKHNLSMDIGVDHYTSASSDLIDLRANSSASSADTRVYPSLTWSVENNKKGTTWGSGLALSHEFDYMSYSAHLDYAVKTKDRSGEFSAKLQAYLDQVLLIAPTELRTGGGRDRHYGTSARNTFDASFAYTQIINQRLDIMLLADIVAQNGYLSLPFHRVYTSDGKVHQEHLPDTRLKLPLGIRANYFLADRFILRAYYRFYSDSWGIQAHTASLELPIKITPFISLSPFYRYYQQVAAQYFAGFMQHDPNDTYYTSNFDLSSFTSNFYGMGVRFAPPKGVLGMQRLSMLELRYGHYAKNIGMVSDIISMNLKFK